MVLKHENAGDAEQENNSHEEAVQHYQSALALNKILETESPKKARLARETDAVRISEKLGYALSLGRSPQAASPFFERTLQNYLGQATSAKTIEILLQRARQLYISVRIKDAIPLLSQAIEIAETDGSPRLRVLTNSKMADYLIGMARYSEALPFVQVVEGIVDERDPRVYGDYLTQKASLHAAFGEAREAVAFFERATAFAQQSPDPIDFIGIWNTYAAWAEWLGRIELSKACRDRALFMARKYHVTWGIALMLDSYAGFLFRIGNYDEAYEYLHESLSYDSDARRVQLTLAATGILIALRMEDERMLEKCATASTLQLALQSDEPLQIARVVAGFAEWYVMNGRKQEARKLLHEALDKLATREDGYIQMLLIAVARFGRLSDVPLARKFLEPRAVRPDSKVVEAYLALFDAYVAKRKKQSTSFFYAQRAFDGFQTLGLYHFADLAYSLFPKYAQTVDGARVRQKPLSGGFSQLTIREQQVAELVLKGYTNRAIAETLAISERTVETHMTSIMNRLGVRSRYELDHVGRPETTHLNN